jgi:hypothetical protein
MDLDAHANIALPKVSRNGPSQYELSPTRIIHDGSSRNRPKHVPREASHISHAMTQTLSFRFALHAQELRIDDC